MTSTELPENSSNMTSEDELEANNTLVARIPISPDQAENYLRGREIHVSVGYKVDPDLAAKSADLFKQKE